MAVVGLRLCAQIESPNSFLGFSIGAVSGTGNSAGKALTYPSHGYVQPGAGLGLHLHTFIAPYISLNVRLTQSFLPLNAKELGKREKLFPEPVTISKNPTLSHTTLGFGVGTGVRFDWISLYLPVQFALGIYSAPEIQGARDANRTWVESKFSTVQAGLSTGLITNFSITDDFFAGLSILYTTVRSGEKEFERYRYDFGIQTLRYVYRAPVATDLVEVGVLVGLNF